MNDEEKIQIIPAQLGTFGVCHNNGLALNPEDFWIDRVWAFKCETYKIIGSKTWQTQLVPICGKFPDGYEDWTVVSFVGTKEECEKAMKEIIKNLSINSKLENTLKTTK